MAISPIRPTDDEARALAQHLLVTSRTAALAVIHPETANPHVTRIAFGSDDRGPHTLISSLAFHFGALQKSPACSLLLGDPPAKGDPLAFPRLTLAARAQFIPKGTEHDAMRDHWLAQHPKARVYIDFADFAFVRFTPVGAALNGGFGKAYELTAEDLRA